MIIQREPQGPRGEEFRRQDGLVGEHDLARWISGSAGVLVESFMYAVTLD